MNNPQTQHRTRGRGPHRREREQSEYEQRVIDVARVNRMVAGGRRFRFRSTMLIGDKKGKIGLGVAKGADVQLSIQKAVSKAKKNLKKVYLTPDKTIPFAVEGKFKTARVYLKPAKKGHGIVAGSSVRMLCDVAGIEDISAKVLSRGKNKLNITRAALNAFSKFDKAISIHGDVFQKEKPKAKAKKPAAQKQTKKTAPKKPVAKKKPTPKKK